MRTAQQPPSICSSSEDIKYKKAIKQISRLISINSTLKRELSESQDNVVQLQEQKRALEQKCTTMEEELNNVKDKQKSDEQSEAKQIQLQILPKDDLENTGNISDYVDTKKRLEQLEEILSDKNKLIDHYHTQIKNITIENSQLLTKLKKTQNQYSQIEIQFNEKLVENKQKNMLQNKIKSLSIFNKDIMNENQSLKKKIYLFDSTLTFRQNYKNHNQESLQKLKHKNKDLKQQLSKMHKYQKQQSLHIQKLNSLINKQQNYIEQFCHL